MGRVLQFSDVHFGCEHKKAVAAALEYAHATPNDLVLITGDITQKGYPVEFKAAGEWMHWGLVITLLLMIPIHAGAALKHHLIDRDDVFHAMLPVVPLLRPKRTRWQRRWRALEKRVGSTARTLWRGLLGPKAI